MLKHHVEGFHAFVALYKIALVDEKVHLFLVDAYQVVQHLTAKEVDLVVAI